MGRSIKKGLVLLTLVFAAVTVVGLEESLPQQTFTFVGKVISIKRGDITAQGDNGEAMHFAVGRRTVYIPDRLPGVGERVRVSYYFKRGNNVGYQVEILPAEAPPNKK